MKRICLVSLSAGVMLLSCSARVRAEDQLYAILKPASFPTLQGLGWNQQRLSVRMTSQSGKYRAEVKISGTFNRDEWTVTIPSQSFSKKISYQEGIQESLSNTIDGTIQLSGEHNLFTVFAINSRGKVESQEWDLEFPGWNQISSNRMTEETKNRLTWMPAVGLSYINYQENELNPISSLGVFIQAEARLKLVPDRWNLYSSASLTLLPLNNGYYGEATRFLSFEADTGYFITPLNGSWNVEVRGGISYTTMLVSGGYYGFRNATSVEVYPVITKHIGKGRTISASFKIAPLTSEPSFSFSNREVGSKAGTRLRAPVRLANKGMSDDGGASIKTQATG